MNSCTPKIGAGRNKTRKAPKSRLWKFPVGGISSTRAFHESTTDDEDTTLPRPRSLSKKGVEDFLSCASEDDESGPTTVERSGRSLPSSQLSPSVRDNSFSAKSTKKHAPYAEEGYPPSGYLWIWTGMLRRWHRNYFLLETPGVLTHSRRRGSQMRGAFCLRDARVVPSRGHSRQFCIVSPAGVVYLRSMRKDQRGPWISNIRSSIEKYTQCVQQTEKARPTIEGLGYVVEPEEEQVAKHVQNRLNARMSELLPHQAALKWQMNQLTRKINSVKEILGGEGEKLRRTSVSSENGNGLRQQSRGISSRGELGALHEHHMVRHGSLTAELPSAVVSGAMSPRRVKGKNSVDDSAVRNGSSVDVNGLRDRAKMRKCQTPRPTEGRRWSSSRPTPRVISYATTTASRGDISSTHGGRYESAETPRRRSLDTPFQTSLPDSRALSDAGVWRNYQHFIDAVQRTIQKEVQLSIELEMENAALKRLLETHREEEGEREEHSVVEPMSGSTSRSYSTAASEFDAALLENSEDEEETVPLRRGRSALDDDAPRIARSSRPDEELINALEVVRRAEYVTRNSGNSEALVVNLEGAILPKEFEDDADEESALENEDSCELLGVTEPRTRLPAPRPMHRGFSLWNILKNAIGRDLTRITMPATINEPLSGLQRFVEEFEYTSFLNMAAICSHPHERLLYITMFVLSSYNAALPRDSKPFNPLLGETFEWANDQFRFLGEQVSHHPPVSCFNVQGFDASTEGLLYEVHGEFELKSKFWGTTLNVYPTGRMELFLATTNERFVWNKACISIHNLVLGQLWLDFQGEIEVQNITTGDCARVRLAKARGYPLDRGNIEGKIFNAQQRDIYSIDGNFTKAIYARKIPQNGRDEFFHANELPTHAVDQYYMSDFAVGLNDIRGYEASELPRTDTRFRTDVRSLEMGEFALATTEKLRLEEKQRRIRKARRENGQKYIPRWFDLRRPDITDVAKAAEHEHASVWKFRGDYWKKKALRSWGGCPDIY